MSGSIEICKSQGIKPTSTPAPTSYLSQSLWYCLDCYARKSYYACCFVHERESCSDFPENGYRREAYTQIWELRVGPTCTKGIGAQKHLWRRLVTGKAPSGSVDYSVAVSGCV
ncbi:hypothetical protein L195_g001855 [Trifolium pratense]|uniref:Uncharacterized protein n=1 Tax=Trifolium pratense TaxID=57577 RepID=A0A2K3NQT9_TRIPR|nr:hypothetical protein L195_g001855 [Trifolium pratense]